MRGPRLGTVGASTCNAPPDGRVVEGSDGARAVVLRVQHGAAPQHVVEDHQATLTESRDDLLDVSQVAGLIGVDEREVKVRLLRQGTQKPSLVPLRLALLPLAA